MQKTNNPLSEKEIDLGRKLSTAKFNEETTEFFRVMGQFAENPNEVVIISPDEIREDIKRAFSFFGEFGCD